MHEHPSGTCGCGPPGPPCCNATTSFSSIDSIRCAFWLIGFRCRIRFLVKSCALATQITRAGLRNRSVELREVLWLPFGQRTVDLETGICPRPNPIAVGQVGLDGRSI